MLVLEHCGLKYAAHLGLSTLNYPQRLVVGSRSARFLAAPFQGFEDMFIRKSLVVFALSSFGFLACSVETGSQAGFATESWRSPTHHGELSFDSANQAEFTSSSRFHGWHFTLSAQADTVLAVEPQDANLDTLAYLYRADDNGHKIGEYLFKNDDQDGTLGSRIAESLPAGSYFLQVKAAKSLMLGRFEIRADCSGAGCPVAPGPDPKKFCDSAHEAIEKCLDDSLDATEEGCAPDARDSEAVLCCNLVPTEGFCEDVCSWASAELARYWGSSTDLIADVFPQDENNEIISIADHGVANCLHPSLDDIAAMILAADQLPHEDDWNVLGWLNADAPGFIDGNITQEVVNRATQIVGEAPTSRFGATVEVPCQNCTDGYAIDALHFTKAGRVLIIESRWGYDS